MDEKEIADLLEELMAYSRIPRNIRMRIEDSIKFLETDRPKEEKISHITTVLDDAANDPNVSSSARTHIWSVISILEQEHNV
jgi:uncharacterized protein (UPF0147 family)